MEEIIKINLTHPIKGKVAGILNARELVINIGKDHGVTTDMIFKILADTPLDVKDPDTGEHLGQIDREKVRVRVSEVQDKISVCITYRKTGGSYVMRNLSSAFAAGLLDVERVETLKASDKSFPPPLSEDESYVKKGDRVVEVISDSE